MTSATLDTQALRQAYCQFPTGVVAIAVQVDGEPRARSEHIRAGVPRGLDPLLVALCTQNTSATWPRLAGAARLGVSALGAGHGGAARSLGSKDSDRFVGLTTKTTCEGPLFIDGATAWLDTCVQDTVPAGDHAIVILRVHGLTLRPQVSPNGFHAPASRQKHCRRAGSTRRCPPLRPRPVRRADRSEGGVRRWAWGLRWTMNRSSVPDTPRSPSRDL
ncbi:flavin reductase family protein [Streptomyces sp. NPDC001601]|uniref:flavin reductase family protein n=1 Tax=Streptomyces sp. NPDC001601 TaxID=3364592 RepID=UPI0036837FB5